MTLQEHPSLPLLGPAFEEQTAPSFATYVRSLYDENSGKRTKTPKMKKPKLFGKKLKSATKKAPGEFEVRFGTEKTSERIVVLTFGTDKFILATSADLLAHAEALTTSPEALTAFIVSKKYFIKNESVG